MKPLWNDPYCFVSSREIVSLLLKKKDLKLTRLQLFLNVLLGI